MARLSSAYNVEHHQHRGGRACSGALWPRGAIEHYGVLRAYLTRHGAGPLPTHDEALDELLPERHNHPEGWQGRFRRGHPDAVLLRYALETVGNLSGLLLSHLDVFQRGVTLNWCESYSTTASPGVERIPPGGAQDLEHQSTLTKLLMDAWPQYAMPPIDSAVAFLEGIAGITSLPVVLGSYGATYADVHEK